MGSFKMIVSNKTDKQALDEWDEHRKSIRQYSPVDTNETLEQKAKRIKELEADPQAWKEYYFKKFMTSESPAFHKKASKRLHKEFAENKHWYEVRHWVRNMSKTTTAMMDVIMLVMTGKLKNIIYTSSTYDAAEQFLEKYRAQLDSNQRLINDYGEQENPGKWTMGGFTTLKGVKFVAIGAGQSPRGNSNEEIRPDCLIMDDFDTDEECLNPDIINKKWRWFEQALFFTVDTARPYLILWLGNIIAEDCCVVRAGKMADHVEIINIRDEYGNSMWPEKNSDEDIDYQISKVSYESSQQEMFNNPMREGQTFKELTWGKCPPLSQLQFAISYADPGYSNKPKPSGKSKVQNSSKAVVLLGHKDNRFYVYKCFLDHGTQHVFIGWLYSIRRYVGNKTVLYSFIENNSLQDPFYQQVLRPLIYEVGEENGGMLSLSEDTERKGEKWHRVEADLEPLVRNGELIFNIDEKDDPHMKRLAAQFKSASITSKTLDGPDATQGAYKETKKRLMVKKTEGITIIRRPRNKHRY